MSEQDQKKAIPKQAREEILAQEKERERIMSLSKKPESKADARAREQSAKHKRGFVTRYVLVATLVLVSAFAAFAATHDNNLREPTSGQLNKFGYYRDTQSDGLTFSATGCTLTTPTSYALFGCATHSTVPTGWQRGSAAATGGTTSSVLVSKPGLYRICANLQVAGVATAVMGLQIMRKDGAGSFAALAQPALDEITVGAGPIPATFSQQICGLSSVSIAEAAAGVRFAAYAKASTGNYVGTLGNLFAEKIDELSPATGY